MFKQKLDKLLEFVFHTLLSMIILTPIIWVSLVILCIMLLPITTIMVIIGLL